MRPQSGWGTVAELMDTTYQARAFYGGPDGPNYPSPRGLLDIPGWPQMDKGEAAQAVEVSAYPDRYQNYEPVARTILDTLTRPGGGNAGVPGDTNIPETSRLVFPLPTGSYLHTSSFGPRIDPITGELRLHAGTDRATPDGTPIFALADGLVTYAGMVDGYSGQITIEHTIGGEKVATKYIHMWAHGIHVHHWRPGHRRPTHRRRRILRPLDWPASALPNSPRRRERPRRRPRTLARRTRRGGHRCAGGWRAGLHHLTRATPGPGGRRT